MINEKIMRMLDSISIVEFMIGLPISKGGWNHG